ncbi:MULTISPECIES: alanine dehydrogenase [unclassified Proteiniphilum]|jgi:alanine dehydrogenase|uniref:alanine dehydrogenase n=2 Tax=unclassified Proteiniphilum TaxID=2622718 RepID=UPI00257E1AF0|nr:MULTISPECIES: alanine dehydrogenase [unclassified Proteiniphilum]MDD2247589.1 alanine dehydrogenase [Proteiniphilum sp.]
MINDSQKSTSFFVRELLLKAEKQKVSTVIGIPKENQEVERRLALTPEAVSLLVSSGYRVLFEAGAGYMINYSDSYYAESGAEIVETAKEVFQADLILKILPPTLEEVQMMRLRSTVFSFLYLHRLSTPLLELMSEKKINALAYELIYDETGVSPFVTSISEIEGASSITLAAELLSNAHGGKGILLGGIPGISPTEVVIIGAGVAGAMAARAAMALGASVKVFDDDISKLRNIRHELGSPVFTSILQPNVLRNVFRSADVVIGAMQYINKSHFYRISGDLIREMKRGAIIIDLRMAQGGCFETTMEACLPGHPSIFEKFGVLHFCEMSLSSRVARTSSIALSNIFVTLFSSMADCGGVDHFARFDRGFASGFYMYAGKMVNSYVANHFNFPVSDIGLFLHGY